MTNDRSVDLFSNEEKKRISRAVAAAEATTSGEIATMVVGRSDRYPEAIALGAVLCAGFLAFAVAVATHHITIWSYVPLVFILYFPAHWLLRRLEPLQRPFINRKRLEEAVRERAVRAFYEQGLYRTRQETGILIFISLFERKVWILGDRGINARIAPESWQSLVAVLSEGIRSNRACEALCAVIASCGEELARHFPREDDDRNELPDEVLG